MWNEIVKNEVWEYDNFLHEETVEHIKKEIVINVSIIEPNAPVYVLFGLILVNLGPLNILPKMQPPKSDAMHPNNNIKSKYFIIILFEEKRKIATKVNT